MDEPSQQKLAAIRQDNGEIGQPSKQKPGPIVQGKGRITSTADQRSLGLALPSQAQSARACGAEGFQRGGPLQPRASSSPGLCSSNSRTMLLRHPKCSTGCCGCPSRRHRLQTSGRHQLGVFSPVFRVQELGGTAALS